MIYWQKCFEVLLNVIFLKKNPGWVLPIHPILCISETFKKQNKLRKKRARVWVGDLYVSVLKEYLFLYKTANIFRMGLERDIYLKGSWTGISYFFHSLLVWFIIFSSSSAMLALGRKLDQDFLTVPPPHPDPAGRQREKERDRKERSC